MAETRIEERALHEHIHRRTVRLLDFTDKSAGGSAVTVKLGKRFFLATAAHVIPKLHEIEVLVGESHEDNIRRFAAWHVNEKDDVGLLELDESAAHAIKREFTDAGQLELQLDQSSNWPATLIGYASQCIATESVRRGATLRLTHSFSPLTLVTQLIPTDAWPKSAQFQRRPPRPKYDLFVQFDPKTVRFQQDRTNLDRADSPTEVDEIDLRGMSGCGIWLDRTLDDGVWRPEPILVGIDTGVSAAQGWARGTLITRWLALAAKHYREFNVLRRQLRSGLR